MVGEKGTRRKDEQLRARISDATRDLVERHAVFEHVGEAVGVVTRYQRVDRIDVAEEIADRHASLAGLLARDADGHARGVNFIRAEDGHGMETIQFRAELAAGRFPIELGGGRLRGQRQGLPSYTQYECPESFPAFSASSFVI